MNSLRMLAISDGVLLNPDSLKEAHNLITKMQKRDIYTSLKWSDLSSDESFAKYQGKNSRRYNAIGALADAIKGSENFPNLSGNQGHNQILDYLIILMVARNFGFCSMKDFVENSGENSELDAFLFLLRDGMSPSTKGFILLQKRIIVFLDAIKEIKKTRLEGNFKITDEFTKIRENSPMKTRFTEHVAMIRALKFSKLAEEECLTSASYAALAAVLLYKETSLGEKERGVLSEIEHTLNNAGFKNRTLKIRLSEAILFLITEGINTKYKELQLYLEKLFCIKDGGINKAWQIERKQAYLQKFSLELFAKYQNLNPRHMIYELAYRTKERLSGEENTEIITEIKMRGE